MSEKKNSFTGEPALKVVTPKQNDGPSFLSKLKDEHVTIESHTGKHLTGTILAFNRYEILFLEDETITPILLMKNFIACIYTDESNPFAEKVSKEVLQL